MARPKSHIVVIGVAGSGKSTLGLRIAHALNLPFIEGDQFHPPRNVEQMRRGQPLEDQDRWDWLQRLGQELANHPNGAVLACSALKRSYRDILRAAVPNAGFVHLRLPQALAAQRVAKRVGHYYPPSLVASQFQTLQEPNAEPNVLDLDARLTLEDLTQQAVAWLAGEDPVHSP